MPYILKHRDTGEVAAAVQRNKYDLDYFGALWWPEEADALQAAAGRAEWIAAHVTESKLKVLNVKLNNDAGRTLFLADDGTLRVETSSAR
ncbi:hypothetical protein MO973_18980 [Paenibacillus sp. TRM 82003]|nr:hypothetical protein [Paenibacillus sp. TRM 82003]